MTERKKTGPLPGTVKRPRGGPRPGAGRKPDPNKLRKTTVYLTPENDAYRKEIGKSWHGLVNEFLEQNAGCEPGTAGRRLFLTLPKGVGDRLPANNDEARTAILEAVREWLKLKKETTMKFSTELLEAIAEEKELFDLVKSMGEGVFGKIHILDCTAYEDRQEFRVYHAGGYCWDVSREDQYDDDGKEIEPFYDFSENWEGFKRSGVEFAIREIKKIKKLNNEIASRTK